MFIKNGRWLSFLTVTGSHAYGLNTPESDMDYRGFCFGTKENYLYTTQLNQLEGPDSLNAEDWERLGKAPEKDIVIYEFLKFIQLLQDNNPNIIELVYCEPSDVVFKDDVYDTIRENRDLFLCRNIKNRLAGYSFSQMKRLSNHRKWLLEAPPNKPERAKYNLLEGSNQVYLQVRAEVLKVLETLTLDAIDVPKEIQGDIRNKLEERLMFDYFNRKTEEERLAPGVLYASGIPQKYVDYFNREAQYKRDLKHYHDYLRWRETRNLKRASLESKCGYDSKHAVHVMRLMRMSVEVLEGKGLNVRRTHDREELMSLRLGEWPFEKLEEEFVKLNALADKLHKTTTLQRLPNHSKIKELCINIVEQHLRKLNAHAPTV